MGRLAERVAYKPEAPERQRVNKNPAPGEKTLAGAPGLYLFNAIWSPVD